MVGYPVAGDLDPLDSWQGDVEPEDTAVDVLPVPALPAEVDGFGRLKLFAALFVLVLMTAFEVAMGREADGLVLAAVLMLPLEIRQVKFINQLRNCFHI